MTDKFKGWYPDYIENEKKREPILKLAKMMTGRAKKKLGLEKMTKYDPEYWGPVSYTHLTLPRTSHIPAPNTHRPLLNSCFPAFQ